jgi:hypothetical protein
VRLKVYFFADETWFCINSLLLGHITASKIFCIEYGEKINLPTMSTDTVKWHFGNARQTVGKSTNKLTTAALSMQQIWL